MPFVASGSYGCVFRPHLRCVEKVVVSRGTIGKVFADEEEYEIEQHAQSMVYKVDPRGEFTVTAQGACSTNPIKQRPTDNIAKCTLVDAAIPNKQIIYPNGGKSLDDIIFDKAITKRTFLKLLRAMGPIFKGLTLFKKHGIIHQDIKPDNIVYDGSHLRLIDFGILSSMDTHYTSVGNKHMLSADYPYFPPEYKLIHYGTRRSSDYITSRYLDNFVFSLHIAGHVVNLPTILQRELDIDIDDEMRQMHAMLKQKQKTNRTYDLSAFIDVYQLGLCVFMMWCAIPGKNKNVPGLKNLLRNMIQPNVFKRATAAQAWQQYQGVVS